GLRGCGLGEVVRVRALLPPPSVLGLLARGAAREAGGGSARRGGRCGLRQCTSPTRGPRRLRPVPALRHPQAPGTRGPRARPAPPGYVRTRIIFTGNMSSRPNVEAVRCFVGEISPRICREVPDAQFYIVGMDPAPAVRRLAEGDRIVITGRVDDVRPYLDSA